MALYWPKEHVALDIVDDPYRHPFEGDESYTVLRVKTADLCDYDSYRKVMGRLCELLGKEVPSMPGWESANRQFFNEFMRDLGDLEEQMMIGSEPPSSSCYDESDYLPDVEILATSAEEAERMSAAARYRGQHVRGVSLWQGPVPSGSFEVISDTTRMSTPEYFFLRKANQLPFAKAVNMGIELCGRYRTVLTQYNKGDEYDYIKKPRTTVNRLRHYLREARGTKEGKRAKRILRYVIDECGSPMGCYLYMLLCLPRSHGSYGLERATPAGVFEDNDGLMPSSAGDYLVYDLCWPKKRVALQYTGSHLPGDRQMEALCAGGMRVMCVTDADIADTDRFDAVAHGLATLLDLGFPEETKKWLSMRKSLRKQVLMPRFDGMELTLANLSKHVCE